MSHLNEEIQQLQLRILELEKQKKEDEEKYKKESLEHNFTVINNLLNYKKNIIKNSKYPKSEPYAKYYDELLVKHLEATYNILQIFNDRISKLENK